MGNRHTKGSSGGENGQNDNTWVETTTISVMGDSAVGKSSIIAQFVTKQFVEIFDPTIEDVYDKTIQYNEKQHYLRIHDTCSGLDLGKSFFIEQSNAFICVYSIDSRDSFDKICTIREEILRIKDHDKVPMVLVGNKIDLNEKRQVATEEGRELAKHFNIPFYETSAKTNINIEDTFFECIQVVQASVRH